MADARSLKYQRIKTAMEAEDPKALFIYFDRNTASQTRKLLPLALGTSKSKTDHSDVEMILCYQYFGYSGNTIDPHHPNLDENCRCFKVASLRDPTNPGDDQSVTVIDFDSATEGWDPPELSHRELNKQSCIEDVEVPE